jgi:hypothetical protein
MAKNNSKSRCQNFREFILFKIIIIYGKKENLEEYFQNMAFVERGFSKNNNSLAPKVPNLTLG